MTNEIIRGAIVFLTFGCAIIIGVFVVMAWKGRPGTPKRPERLSIDAKLVTINQRMKGIIK